MTAVVHAAFKDKMISTVWHPEAQGDLLTMHNGVNVRVMTGEAAYQHTDGTIVRI